MDTLFIAYLKHRPSPFIVIATDSEVSAYEFAARYWSTDIIKCLVPKHHVDEEGNDDIYFPTNTTLADLIGITKYEVEDGFSFTVFSKS